MIPSEYLPYEPLPVGVLAFRSGKVVYANDATAGLIGVSKGTALIGQDVHEMASRFAAFDERELAVQVADAIKAGKPLPGTMWMRAQRRGSESRAMRGQVVQAPIPGDLMVMLLEADAEVVIQKLAEAMVVAARELMCCRDERDVLEAAAEAIHRQGYYLAIFRLEGEYLTHGAYRESPEMLKKAEEVYGVPAEQVRFPKSGMPHLDRLFETRRASFSDDAFELVDSMHSAEMAKLIRASLPKVRTMETPIFVNDRPWGVITVQGDTLNPSAAATLELFSQLISSALENVGHLRAAEQRLRELTELQNALVARERLAAIGQAAGVLSHEARNPLGAILNAIAVLRKKHTADPDDTLLLDIAEEEALKLDVLVRDLMELARPLEARLRPLHPESILEAAISDLKRRQRTPAQFDISVPSEGVPEIDADPTLLKLALENLLRNAVQLSNGAAVRIAITHESDAVSFAVDDAMDPRDVGSAGGEFDPFSILASRGTSLGLAVVKRLVEAQGGTVRACDGGHRLEAMFRLTSASAVA